MSPDHEMTYKIKFVCMHVDDVVLFLDPDDPERERELMKSVEVREDMRAMEARKRVSEILNSRAFREELEEIIESQVIFFISSQFVILHCHFTLNTTFNFPFPVTHQFVVNLTMMQLLHDVCML